jgi:hypothetical protein
VSVRALPSQVKVVCDDCGVGLGENEDGYTVLTDSDASGDRAELIDQYGWTGDGEKHRCGLCSEKAGLW